MHKYHPHRQKVGHCFFHPSVPTPWLHGRMNRKRPAASTSEFWSTPPRSIEMVWSAHGNPYKVQLLTMPCTPIKSICIYIYICVHTYIHTYIYDMSIYIYATPPQNLCFRSCDPAWRHTAMLQWFEQRRRQVLLIYK